MFSAIGELLVDFLPADNFNENHSYIFKAGGAPANVACGTAKLGIESRIISKVGKDYTGKKLKEEIEKNGVNTDMITESGYNTTLAIVSLDEKGERGFSFYRNNTADINLNHNDFSFEEVRKSKIIHFGSLGLTANPSRKTHYNLLKDYRGITTFDPNLRLNLWSSKNEAKKVITDALNYADVVKMSYDELVFISDESDTEKAMKKIYTENMSFMVITLGEKGSLYYDGNQILTAESIKVKPVDTTGAGDAFMSGIIYYVDSFGLNMEINIIKEMLKFSNICGALTTTKKGAIGSFPEKEEILKYMESEG